MPTTSNGLYTLPEVYEAEPNTTIITDQHNLPLEDIAQALTERLTRNGAGRMTGPLTLAGDASLPLHAVPLQQIQNLLAGYTLKAPARVATTANITLSGLQTIDGVTVIAGDRVLVKSQTDATTNGLYVASATTWQRTTDMDAWPEVPGASVWVQEGTANASSSWVCSPPPGGSLGSTAINWYQNAASGSFQPVDALLTSIAALTLASGDLIIGTGANVASRLAKATDGWYLRLVAGVPAWQALPAFLTETAANDIYVRLDDDTGFVSAQQTITPNGSLTLAHGLGAAPARLALSLVCQSTDLTFSAGAVLHKPLGITFAGIIEDFSGSDVGINEGAEIWADATNLHVKFAIGLAAGPGATTTGVFNYASAPLTNSKWKLVVRAWL